MIQGIKETTERHTQLKNIWDVCKEAGLQPPVEVIDFFGGQYPEQNTDVVDLSNHPNIKRILKGYKIDLDGLPDGLKTIRVEIPRGSAVEMAQWDLEELLPKDKSGWVLLASLFGGDGTGYSRSTFYKEARKLLDAQKGEVREIDGGLHVRRLPAVEEFVHEINRMDTEPGLDYLLKNLIVGYLPKDFRYYTDALVFPILLTFIQAVERQNRTHEKSGSLPDSDWELLWNEGKFKELGDQFGRMGLLVWGEYVFRACKRPRSKVEEIDEEFSATFSNAPQTEPVPPALSVQTPASPGV